MATRAERAGHGGVDLGGRVRRWAQLWADLFGKHELLTYASSIARTMLVAAVAILLLLLGLAGATGRQDLWRTHLAPEIQKRVLPQVYAGIDQTVEHIFRANSPGLIAFALVLAVWEVSGSVRGVSGALNRICECREDRSWKVRFPLSFALALAVVVAVVTALLLVMAVGGLVHGAWGLPFAVVRWGGAIVLIGLAFGLLVRFAPAKRKPTSWASLGTALVVTAWVVEALVFRWYLTYLADFKTAVGSLTVVLFVVAFLYVASIILLVGMQADELVRGDGEKAKQTVFGLLRGALRKPR